MEEKKVKNAEAEAPEALAEEVLQEVSGGGQIIERDEKTTSSKNTPAFQSGLFWKQK